MQMKHRKFPRTVHLRGRPRRSETAENDYIRDQRRVLHVPAELAMLPMHGGRVRHTRPASSLRAAGIVFFLLLVGAIGLAGYYLRQSQIIVGDLKDEVHALKGAQTVVEAARMVAASKLAEATEKATESDQSRAELQAELDKQAAQLKLLAAEKLATSAAHREERKQLESQIQTAEAATGAAEAVAARSAAVAMDATQALVTANKNLREAASVSGTSNTSVAASTLDSNTSSSSVAGNLPGTPADIVAAQAGILSLNQAPLSPGSEAVSRTQQASAGGASEVALGTPRAPGGAGRSTSKPDVRSALEGSSGEDVAAQQGASDAKDGLESVGMLEARQSSGSAVTEKLEKAMESKGQNAEVATAQGSAGTAVMLANEQQATGGGVVY